MSKISLLIKRLKLYGKIGLGLALFEAVYVGLKAWVFNDWVSPDPILFFGIVGIMFIAGYVTGIDLVLTNLELKENG